MKTPRLTFSLSSFVQYRGEEPLLIKYETQTQPQQKTFWLITCNHCKRAYSWVVQYFNARLIFEMFLNLICWSEKFSYENVFVYLSLAKLKFWFNIALILGSIGGTKVLAVGKAVGRTPCPANGMKGKLAGIPYPGFVLWKFQWECTWERDFNFMYIIHKYN